MRDLSFACVVLGACAVGSRYCDDIRVLAKVRKERENQDVPSPPPLLPWEGSDPWIDDLEQGFDDETSFTNAPGTSAGWKYYDRVQRYHTSMMAPATLMDLQTIFVSNLLLDVRVLAIVEITSTAKFDS